MKFGMTEEQFDLLKRLVITPLKVLGADVYIFGSRVGTSYHQAHRLTDSPCNLIRL